MLLISLKHHANGKLTSKHQLCDHCYNLQGQAHTVKVNTKKWIFCRKPPPKKNTPATALIQLEFLFIDGIQRCQLIFCPNPKICSIKNVAGVVFLKSHIFAIVARAFYKRSKKIIGQEFPILRLSGIASGRHTLHQYCLQLQNWPEHYYRCTGCSAGRG